MYKCTFPIKDGDDSSVFESILESTHREKVVKFCKNNPKTYITEVDLLYIGAYLEHLVAQRSQIDNRIKQHEINALKSTINPPK